MHPDTRHGHNKAQNRAERVANTASLQQQDNALAELTECTFVHILHPHVTDSLVRASPHRINK